MMKINKQEKHR